MNKGPEMGASTACLGNAQYLMWCEYHCPELTQQAKDNGPTTCVGFPGFSGSVPISGQCLILQFFAAAVKSLQTCPTLCDPIDGSPSVSPVLTELTMKGVLG